MRNASPAAIRDQALRRVRRLTAGAIAGATALTAAFAGLAAGSTHTSTKNLAATKQPTAAAQPTVTAPEPSLTPSGSSATPPPSQSRPQPSQAVTPSAQPPVAVTGGS